MTNQKVAYHWSRTYFMALGIVALAAYGTLASAAPATFQVGRARACITPPLGVHLAGYFHVREAKSVFDDLYARAVVIESNEMRVALVSCDLISMTAEAGDAAKAMIEAETGIPAGNIMVCATHTHTGPELRTDASMERDEAWTSALPRRIADAVARADASKVPATLRAGKTEVAGYSFNRLFRLEDGGEVFGKRGGDKAVLGVAGPIDPSLQTLSAVDMDGQLIALLVNFALHPDVIGGGNADFIAADWPGLLGDAISAVYGEDVVTLLLQGTCGDINHRTHEATALPTGGPAKALQLGRALAGAAMVALERAEPMTDPKLSTVTEVLSIPYYTRDAQFFEELEALEKKEAPNSFELSVIRRGREWPHDGQMADVPVQALRIGDVGLIAFPAEIFVRIGLEIKQWSIAPRTFIVELANDRVSTYIPDPSQAERGAYGAKPILSRWLHAEAGRRLADAAIQLLHQLFSEPPATSP